jgi:hypothetical protein
LLLYKDARVDQNILDETFGNLNWQRSHQLIGDRLYCTVSVWDEEKKQWISKQDVGTESYTEKEKGQASDSFKRACFNLGIGRELYTAPFIWIPSSKCEIKQKKSGDGYTTYDRFFVSDIGYDEAGNINHLIVYKEKPREKVYTYDGKGEAELIKKNEEKITKTEAKRLDAALSENQKEWVYNTFSVSSLEELTGEQYGTLTREVDQKSKEKGKNES